MVLFNEPCLPGEGQREMETGTGRAPPLPSRRPNHDQSDTPRQHAIASRSSPIVPQSATECGGVAEVIHEALARHVGTLNIEWVVEPS